MREIKFRAWDGENMYVPSLVFSGGSFVIGYEDDSGCAKGLVDDPIMQFTGLKDKNGVEIYEGDILRSIDDWTIAPCKWDEESAAFEFATPKRAYFAWEWLEVIGNIYQSPEFLK